MRLFNNIGQLIGLLLLSQGVSLAGDQELVLLTGIHTKVFSRENLFEEKNKETEDWSNMLNYLQGYVVKNSNKNKKLLKAFSLYQDVSNQLINTLKISYNSVFVGTKDSSKVAVKSARNSIKKLKKRKSELENMSAKLERTHFFSKKKKNIKEVLLRLSLTLDLTINKLANDFEKQRTNKYWNLLLADYENN